MYMYKHYLDIVVNYIVNSVFIKKNDKPMNILEKPKVLKRYELPAMYIYYVSIYLYKLL